MRNFILVSHFFLLVFQFLFQKTLIFFTHILIGPEILLYNYNIKNPVLSRLFDSSKIGIYYKYTFHENNNYILCGYNILPKIKPGTDNPLMYVIGINGIYNINKIIFGIIPELGAGLFGIITLSYRYNIMLDSKTHNEHEIMFKFGIPIYSFLSD